MLSLVRTLSGELISRGIRVNPISPRPISTPLYGKLGLSSDDLASVEAYPEPVSRWPVRNTVEIANAVVFLASDESAFTVGNDLMIDGGLGNL